MRPTLAGLLGERDGLGRPGERLAPAPAAQVEVRPRGERIDQRHHRAGVAIGADEPRQHRLGAVEVLRPDRRVPGHPEHLGRRGERVAAEQERLRDPQQLLARGPLADGQVRLADHDHREQLECRLAPLGQLARPVGGADQRGHVADAHREDRGLEVHRRRAQRVVAADGVGLGHQLVVGVGIERGADTDVRAPAADLGVHPRVGPALRGRAQVAQRLLALADRGGVARRLEQPPGAIDAAGGELGGARQVARRGAGRAAPARLQSRRLERGRDLLVGRDRRRGEMPRAAGAARRGDVGERPVDDPAVERGGGVVGGRAQQRMAEVDPPVLEADQAGRLGGLERGGVEAEHAERAEDRVQPPALGRRGDEHGALRVLRQPLHAAPERRLDPGAGAQRRGERLATLELGVGQQGRDLQQRERVPARPVDEPVGDRQCQLRALGAGQQAAGILRLERADLQALQPRADRDLGAAVGAEQHDPLGAEPAAGEQQRLERAVVEPLAVVDERQQRLLLGGRREQAEDARHDGVAVAAGRLAERQRPAQRRRLRRRDRVEPVEQRPEQLAEPREGQVGLRLHPARAEHRHARGDRFGAGVLEQRRLADPGFPDEQQRAAPPGPRVVQEPVDPRAFRFATDEHHRDNGFRRVFRASSASARGGRRPGRSRPAAPPRWRRPAARG